MQGLRRRGAVFCCALLIAGVAVAPFAPAGAQPAAGEEAAALAADAALENAMRAGDKSAARRLLSLEFSYVDEDGAPHSRKEFLADLAKLAPAPATGASVKVYGLVAMITGHRKSAQDNDVFFLDIWAKEKRAWRALARQDVVLAATDAPEPGREPPELRELRSALAQIHECKNPCETIPYRVRSPAEQEIVNAFQAAERSMAARDAEGYAKHFAPDFVHYESGLPPVPKAERIGGIAGLKAQNEPADIPAVHSMRLWVYADGAAMISTAGLPDDTDPLLRSARVWAKHNGQWQMEISVQTLVK